jgi:CRISPR-associated endonuclease/helicase Cas3
MTGASPIYAHTLEGQPPSAWETLDDHAARVAQFARSFADAFGAGDWGEWLGLWHDLGKRSDEFQRRIGGGDPNAAENETAPGRVDHSTFGARHACRTVRGLAGQLLAFCIAGHHGSLPDATASEEEVRRSTLTYRLDEKLYPIPAVSLPNDFPVPTTLRFPFTPPLRADEVGFAVAFFARMLFSALIDADRTATEAFCDRPKSDARNCPKPALGDLRTALDEHLLRIQADAPKTRVNQIRASVLTACKERASLPPGFFSLNVPTGGGKTFASLAFALHHAMHHPALRRVVVAIPFTSIIEQTAEEYRKALGPLAEFGLVEHHSNIEPKRQTRANQFAVENWDAPLVVTTNVQLYESLFASRTTPCRKLHRLANSVIILDEAQTLPVDLLAPTLAALRELVARYGCTVVLCTATQPALEHRPREFEIGLANVRPIITDAPTLYANLKRVEVHRLGILSDDELVQRLANERAALCVVNTRPHAAKLYDAIVARRGSPEGCYHLSTFMCAQHRRDALGEIRTILKEKRPCLLISTQLVEAGVDVDFPAVFRAPTGFDSLAQAAGRCNREGKLTLPNGQPSLGRVYAFDTQALPPPGMLRNAAQTAKELFDAHADPLAPSAVEAYFRLFYWSRQHEWDKHKVLPCFADLRPGSPPPFMFRQAADAYQIIREEQTPIVVPYLAQGRAMRDELLRGSQVDYRFQRAAQRFTVSVCESLLRKLAAQQVIVEHESGLWAWANDAAYSLAKGMSPQSCGIDPFLGIV